MKEIFESFNGKTVVVTGANGFIGNRLIELLVTKSNCNIRAIVRNVGNAIHLARHPIELVQGDILQKNSCHAAFKDADYVFHCAYGNKGDSKTRHTVNLEGTKNVLELAPERKVSGFLFLSTMAVYKVKSSGTLTEHDLAADDMADDYGKSKLAAERLVLEFGKLKELPVVILQPTGVFGPWAQSYGIRLIELFNKFQLPLLKDSRGTANVVYVDDLVQAMLRSVLHPAARGNKYLINGSSVETWKEFIGRFEALLNKKCFVELSRKELLNLYKSSLRKPPFFPTLLRSIKIDKNTATSLTSYPLIRWIIRMLNRFFPGKLTRFAKPHQTVNSSKKSSVLPVDEATILFYASESRVSFDRAKQDFGYTPEFSTERGFLMFQKWYKWYFEEMNI